ncbi:MAG: hypothetical protein AMXMBFR84_17800 [Candidatus Hydrogenedentota bacterium]
MTQSENGRRFGVVASLLLLALVVLAYAPSFKGGYVWDDYSSIVLNQHVQDPSAILSLFAEDFHTFGRGKGNFYRPIQAVTYMVEYAMSSPMTHPAPGATEPWMSPFLFRVGNALWHAFASIMLLALLGRLGVSNGVRFVLCALYAVHPIHTEAVAYISGRADSLSAGFMFASLYCVLSDRRWVSTGLSMVWFVVALCSKESSTMLPFLLLALWLTLPRNEEGKARRKSMWIPMAASGVIVAIYGVLRMTVLQFSQNASGRELSFADRAIEAMQALALYAGLFFVPTGLHMERTLDDVPVWLAAVGLLLLVTFAGVAFIAWRKGWTPVAFGLLWFLITWLPISGLFPLNAPMAEHWMYVPMAGFMLALLTILGSILRATPARTIAAGVAFAVCTAFVILTVQRADDWTSNEKLYLATLRENPNTTRVHYNLAVTYEELIGNPPGAKRHYEAVLAIYDKKHQAAGISPSEVRFTDEELESHLSLGKMALDQQRFGEALPHYTVVLRLQPTDETKPLIAAASLGAGQCLLALGDPEKAQQMFQQAVTMDPSMQQDINRLMGGPLQPATT